MEFWQPSSSPGSAMEKLNLAVQAASEAGDNRALKSYELTLRNVQLEDALKSSALQRQMVRQDMQKTRMLMEAAAADKRLYGKVMPMIRSELKSVGLPDVDFGEEPTPEVAKFLWDAAMDIKQAKLNRASAAGGNDALRLQGQWLQFEKASSAAKLGQLASVLDAITNPAITPAEANALYQQAAFTTAENARFLPLARQARRLSGQAPVMFVPGEWQNKYKTVDLGLKGVADLAAVKAAYDAEKQGEEVYGQNPIAQGYFMNRDMRLDEAEKAYAPAGGTKPTERVKALAAQMSRGKPPKYDGKSKQYLAKGLGVVSPNEVSAAQVLIESGWKPGQETPGAEFPTTNVSQSAAVARLQAAANSGVTGDSLSLLVAKEAKALGITFDQMRKLAGGR